MNVVVIAFRVFGVLRMEWMEWLGEGATCELVSKVYRYIDD